MRRRLIASTFVVVFVVVMLLGVPLAVIDAHSIEQNAQTTLSSDANSLYTAADLQMSNDGRLDAASLAAQLPHDYYATVTASGQTVLLHGTPPPGMSLIQQVSNHGPIKATVSMPRAPVARQIRSALLMISGVALLALLAAVGLAFLQARRLARPLVDLAETAERLGSGDPRPRHRRYGVTELDRVAEVIDHSAERISHMLGAERRLAADASHQLRTPLTALSMRLEEIIATDDPLIVKEEAAIALGQVERLTSVVQRLLTNARDSRRPESVVPVDIDQIVRQQLHEWRPAFQSARRPVQLLGSRGLVALATPGALAQVLSTLLENSLMHGDGMVTVRSRMTGNSVVLEVGDDGQGVPPELGARVFERAVSGRASTGLGLAVARELAEADGGRLELLQQRPAVFAVFLAAYLPKTGDRRR